MLKIMFSSFFIYVQLLSYSQVVNLLHPFILPDDIHRISAPIKLTELSVPDASVILTRTNYSCNNACGALPVQLLSFDAERKSEAVVKVTWKTTNEYNNKGFMVQRSLVNNGEFKNVGWLAADYNPSITHHYTLLDDNDYESISYYRLQQIDMDGEFSYSRIVAVKGNTPFESISVYPNPATTNVLLSVTLKKMDKVIVDIFNSEGQRVHQQTAYFKKGNNLNYFSLAQYLKGTYFIKVVKSDGKFLMTKFVKQ